MELQETAPIHRIRSPKKKGEWISVVPKSTMTLKGATEPASASCDFSMELSCCLGIVNLKHCAC